VTAAAIVLDPAWLGSLARATTKVALTAPTTWSLGQSATPGVAPLTIALVLLLSAAAAWSSIRGAPPRLWDATVVASGIALSLVVTPYAHLYDYLLLVPAIAVAIAAVEHHGSAARSLALLAYGDESPVNALIPPAVLAGLVLALRWRAGAGGARSQPLPR
jgi:predicted Na+-dependent transporter